MKDIALWLESPDRTFADGLKLHRIYGRDKRLAEFFDKNASAATGTLAFNMLKTELARLLRIHNQNLEAGGPQAEIEARDATIATLTARIADLEKGTENPKPETQNPKLETGSPSPAPKPKMVIVSNPFVDISKLPAELQEKYKIIEANHAEMRELHEGMKDAASDDLRAEFRAEILRLEDQNAACWLDIDEWAESNGAVKEPTPEQKLDPVYQGMLMEKDKRNARQYINRYTKALETETDPEKRAALDQKIEKYRAEFTELEAKLAELQKKTS